MLLGREREGCGAGLELPKTLFLSNRSCLLGGCSLRCEPQRRASAVQLITEKLRIAERPGERGLLRGGFVSAQQTLPCGSRGLRCEPLRRVAAAQRITERLWLCQRPIRTPAESGQVCRSATNPTLLPASLTDDLTGQNSRTTRAASHLRGLLQIPVDRFPYT
jgi:hypothetical protein